jgi:hypothetical protein
VVSVVHSWGSRGRRFKSGRPDWSEAGSGFQRPAFGCNGSARALPSIAPAKRSGVPCRAGILTSDYWHSARPRAGSRPSPPPRVSFLQVKGSPVRIRPSKAGSGQQQPQRGGAGQRLPLCPAWVLAALRRRPHGPSDAHCHRRRSVRRSANWWPFSRSCDCHRR